MRSANCLSERLVRACTTVCNISILICLIHVENCLLFLVTEDGYLIVLGMPNLKVLLNERLVELHRPLKYVCIIIIQLSPIAETQDVLFKCRSSHIRICQDGRITAWSSNREFRHYYVFSQENRHRINVAHGVPYDSSIGIPERSLAQSSSETTSWIGNISRKFVSGKYTNIAEWRKLSGELDLICMLKLCTPTL